MTTKPSPEGWYADPTFPDAARYWNGVRWTDSVAQGGITFNAPIEPSLATLPPVLGTQVRAPLTAPRRRSAVENALPDTGSHSTSTVGAVIAVLVAFFLVILTFAIISNNISSDQSPPSTHASTAAGAQPSTGGVGS